MTDETAAPTPRPKDQQDTYADLTARLAAADLGWSHEHGDPPANPDYIRWLAFQVMAFKPPLIAGVYVDDEMLDDMRDGLHGDNCGCGEWDSHSQEYVERMDETIHAVLYPLRHPARPVSQGTEDSDYREQIARALVPGGDRSTFGRVLDVVAPLVEQLRQARGLLDYNRKIRVRVEEILDGELGTETTDETQHGYVANIGVVVDRLRQARADLETRTRERDYARAELAAVGRAIECFLGVEYGTPVESARALVERCVDAECALDGLRAERDEWWRHFLGRQRGYSDALRGMARRATALRRDRDQVHNQFLDHYNVASVQLDRVLELEEGLRERTDQRDKAVQEARGERHVRRLNELALLGQLSAERESRFRWAEEAGEMAARRDEARADAHRAARYYADQATRRATELAALRSIAVVLPEDWERRLGDCPSSGASVDLVASWRAAPVDEHVREHDDAAPTRDEVVEAWADAWDGVDRTPEWVRVVEPCPVSECTIPQVHGHDGYGLRFTPVAQPAHPRPPLDPPPNSLNERLHIRRSGARLGPMDPSDIGQAENAEWDAEHRAGASPGTGTEAGE